jgi:L,D-peptidoglycan transpeptidase YkuD (ErfK/YbiS/YcfS/YnhG family)
MRRFIMVFVLAAAIMVLQACKSMSYIYKDDGAVSASAQISDAALSASGKAAYSESTAAAVSPIASPEASAGIVPEAKPSAAVSPISTTKDTDAVKKPESSGNSAKVQPQLLQPPLLTQAVLKAGLSFEDLNFSQLVLVSAAGSNAEIYCYDKGRDGLWTFNKTTGYIKGYVGKNGVSSNKSEGDNCTPAGLFGLGYAFGNSAKPATGLEFRAVTKESYWVDDPNSLYYNQWVEGKQNADWHSAEHLSDSKSYYAYAVVVDYNMAPDTVPGKGSAIFLHCKTEPTTGCVAAPQDSILKILKWLSEEKKPGILIVDG